MMNSTNQRAVFRRPAGLATVSGLLMFLLCLLPSPAGATSYTIDAANDLPYTTPNRYDTINVTVNGIISTVAGTSITMDDAHCVLNLNGNTLYVCNAAGATRGVYISADSCEIRNGTLEQPVGAVPQDVAIIATNNGMTIDKLTITNVNVHARTYISGGFRSDGMTELRINGGNWTSYVTDYYTRTNQNTAPIRMGDDLDGPRAAPQAYRAWVTHVTIDSCPHAGISLNGGTIICDSNSVTVDARNHYTWPSSGADGTGTPGSFCTANAYAIAIDRIGANCRVIGNTIRSGTRYQGGRGLALDGQAGYLTHRSLEVAYNDIRTHVGPSAATDFAGNYQAVGVRVRDTGTDSIYFHHNYIQVEMDTLVSTTHTGTNGIALWVSDLGRFWRFENNTFRAIGTPGYYGRWGAGHIDVNGVTESGSMGRCVAFDGLGNTAPDSINFVGNRFESNVTPMSFGELNVSPGDGKPSGGERVHFYNDTINRFAPWYADEWGNDGAWAMGLQSARYMDNYATDVVYEGDTSIAFDGGVGELTYRKTLRITVLGSNGLPVANARVRVRNAYGATVLLDNATDGEGRADPGVVNIRYYHWGVGSDSTFSPFIMSAIYGADSVGKAKSFGLATNGYDTLMLADTGGATGQQDTIAPGQVGDLTVLPASVPGHFTFGWTSTGNDGSLGTADFDSVRFSSSPINTSTWGGATKVARTSAPKAYGVNDQVDISEGAPVPGKFYYVGIKAYDSAGNSSPLAVDSGFARGILAPQIASDMTTIGADSLGFCAPTVRSYLDLYYEFQMALESGFGSPQSAQVTSFAAYACGSFAIPTANDTVYVRCRAAALDLSETSPWSSTRAFSVSGGAVNQPPDMPLAVSPLPDDTVTSLTPSLIVANSADPEGDPVTYQFELYDAAGTTRLAASGDLTEGVANTSWTVPTGIVLDRTTYRWTSRSYDGQSYSSWMSMVTFAVLKLGTQAAPGTGVAYAYPNPVRFASGELAIFVLPDEPVDLTIMTVSGDIVLRRENISGEWRWDGSNQSGAQVSAGLYLWFVSDNRGQGKLLVKP